MTSLDPSFLPASAPAADIAALRSRFRRARSAADRVAILEEEASFDTVCDMLRTSVAELVQHDEAAKALESLTALEQEIEKQSAESDGGALSGDSRLILHAALMQLITALHLTLGDTEQAALTSAKALSLLAREPRRKDSGFLQVLGSLLFDIAYLHSLRSEHKQAERCIDKAISLFARLAKTEPARFAAPHMAALNSATTVYANRRKQAELLAAYQAATISYMEMLEAGAEEAASRLVETLAIEADTLSRMGKHREAMQYYTRALKYLTRIEPTFTLGQLRLSIALGESMLQVSAMREKGVHLLNTMLHKATKFNALDEHRRIVDALYHAKSRTLDILSLWHKMFPK